MSVAAEYRRRVATTSPHRLLLQPLFWREQPEFVLAALCALWVGLKLAPYTYRAGERWDWLVLGVQAIALWGAVITIRALAVLHVEKAIVDQVEVKGADVLRELKSDQRAGIDLDELEERVVPDNKSTPAPAMIRLFQHILKEARDGRFESSVNVVQPYCEEPLHDIFRLQNLQKLALWLGILGTFIGLLLAMQAADLTQLLSEGKFVELVQRMFGGMIVSFSASLAGLQVAVILGVFLLLLRRRQEPYFKDMEAAVVTLLSLARKAMNNDVVLVELGQVRNRITALLDHIVRQSRELSKTQQRIDEQTQTIGDGMTRVAEAGVAFNGFLNGLSEAQRRFIDEVSKVYDMISLRQLGETVQSSVGSAAALMAERIVAATKGIDKHIEDFNGVVAELSGALKTQAAESAETGGKLRDQIASSTAESASLVRGVAAQMQELLARDAKAAGGARAEMLELSRRVAELSRAIEQIRNLPAPRTRSVSEFLTSLRW